MRTVTNSIDENRPTTFSGAQKHKRASGPNKPSAQEKANLRAALSDYLEQADSNPEAAQAALRVCIKLRSKIPCALLTSENLTSTLPLSEVARLLDRLSGSHVTLDISGALVAIRVLVERELRQRSDRRTLLTTTRAVTSRLMKVAGLTISERKGAKSGRSLQVQEINFSEATLVSAIDLALWILSSVFEPQSKKGLSGYPLALRWAQTIEALWRRCSGPGAARHAVRFLSSLQRVLPKSVYADLKVEQSIADFLSASDLALVSEAIVALLEARLRDLESNLTVVARDDNRRNRLISELQGICQSRPSEVVPEAAEWVARQMDVGALRITSPTAADESQSSALDYVSVCLLAAWDAATDGSRSARVLESIRRMAHELFKVDLAGSRGEIVRYDERQHELVSQVIPLPTEVELIRPGVRWSDGVRTRFLVRAVAKPAS